MLKNSLLLIIIAFSTHTASAQLGFSHEVGAIAGPVAFQSDYGERKDFETNSGNTGLGIGLVHYINFAYRADCNCYTKDTYFNDHFKLRNEISWSKTKLNHFGEWVAPERTSVGAKALRGTEGIARVLNLGSQIEFFPYSIRDFVAGGYAFAPFISLGAHYNAFTPSYTKNADALFMEAEVETNPVFVNNDELNIYRADSYTSDPFSSWSIIWSVGTRYKLTPLSDLMLDLRWSYYFTDWADGLNHNGPADKNYDWNVWLNFGYVYYLD